MNIANIFRILGFLLMGFCPTMLPPVGVAFWYNEPTALIFLWASLLTFLLGFLLWFPTRNAQKEIRAREGFLIVTLLWLSLCLVSAIPFILLTYPFVSGIDAIFESISGLTATGATVFVDLDSFPRSILYYRQQLQFVGGGGIILLGISIMPMLGVGGMQLFRAEIPGPFKEEKLTPRINQTAKTLWIIYIGLVLFCTLGYWAAGMSWFDAVGHSYSTVSTGGFSTHDRSLAYFNTTSIQLVAIVFMFLGAVNFSLHFTSLRKININFSLNSIANLWVSLRKINFQHYWHDLEFRTYSIVILILTYIVSALLFQYKIFETPAKAFVESLFQVVTFSTTTGLSSANYNHWPSFVPILLTFISLIGGCGGSTAGGIKMIRGILLSKQIFREIKRLIHPNGHYIIKVGYSRLHYRTLDAVWGFLGVFVATGGFLLLLLLATGLDFITASSALSGCLSATGIGFGAAIDNFKSINDAAKIMLGVAMLAGRLEFFTLLVLLTPSYWRN
jgi:trk system potassium uptake protein TrkH